MSNYIEYNDKIAFHLGYYIKEIVEESGLTQDHSSFYPLIKDAFCKAGVILVILPNSSGSKINGATKKLAIILF